MSSGMQLVISLGIQLITITKCITKCIARLFDPIPYNILPILREISMLLSQ